MSRIFRLVKEDADYEQSHVPWIVQGDHTTHNIWADIARFPTRDEAYRYMNEVVSRQRSLELPSRLRGPR